MANVAGTGVSGGIYLCIPHIMVSIHKIAQKLQFEFYSTFKLLFLPLRREGYTIFYEKIFHIVKERLESGDRPTSNLNMIIFSSIPFGLLPLEQLPQISNALKIFKQQ